MNTKAATRVLFSLVVLFALLDGYFVIQQRTTPRVFDLVFAVVFMIVSYTWYRQDAAKRQYQGSSLMGGAIVLFSAIAVPIYIYKSRRVGERKASFMRLLRFFGLCILASVLLGIAFSLLA
jgi:drug/metabolite transporter (DMT)-like permease